MAGFVPLQVEALPAILEEGIEAGVVVFVGGLDLAQVDQGEGLVADLRPGGLQLLQIGKAVDRHVRRLRHAREGIHEAVDRGHHGGVVQHLAPEPQAHLATEVHVQDGAQVQGHNNPFDQGEFLAALGRSAMGAQRLRADRHFTRCPARRH